MKFKKFYEKNSNPLRKQALTGRQSNFEAYNEFMREFKRRIAQGTPEDEMEKEVYETYTTFKQKFPQRADLWLSKKAEEVARSYYLKSTVKGHTQLFVKFNIPVYLDEYVREDFSPNSLNYRMVNACMDKMMHRIKGIVPVRRPKIVITDRNENKLMRNKFKANAPAVYYQGIIYIDQHHVDDDDFYVHEYAHYVADLIPSQTVELLQNAYKQMLDFYWKKVKKKKEELDTSKQEGTKETFEKREAMREKIAKKLGFPEYGLSNPDEFFAVMIENWHSLPNNAATYKYKSLVKQTLTRL